MSFFQVFYSLVSVAFKDRTTIKFVIGILLGLSFAISVILATIGIMDGFEISLKEKLTSSEGEIAFHSRSGFFEVDKQTETVLRELDVSSFSPLVVTEGFIIFDDMSKGALIKGVEGNSFFKVTGIDLDFHGNEIAIGSELAERMQVKVGMELVIGFADGNREFRGLPLLERFKIIKLVEHGIYEKDSRYVYMDRNVLQKILELDSKVNLVILNTPPRSSKQYEDFTESGDIEKIGYFAKKLRDNLGIDHKIKPFWNDFTTLFQAIKTEKLMIVIILQLVVIVSIFNVLAFIIFINEKRAREMFLFRALGLSSKRLYFMWYSLVVIMWFFGCILSVLFVKLYDILLDVLPFLKLPGDIYQLGKLSIVLDVSDYSIVFVTVLMFIMFISWLGLLKVKRRSILYGIRKEFA